MKTKLIYTIVLIGIGLNAIAQLKQDREEKIEAYKIAFITERLNLTSKEAMVFWPVYNEFHDKQKIIRSAERNKVKAFKQLTSASDAESERFINDYLSFKQQEMDLNAKYINEFKKVLPSAKVAKLVTLEQEFKMQLLKKLKEGQR